MTRSISVSTVLLCWNRVELSKRVLAAYLETISVPFELIVVNNASTDETSLWLDSIKDDRGVTAVRETGVNDPGPALNDALEQTSGELLMVLENDYLMLPGWDRYALECFCKLPSLGQLSICTPRSSMIASRHKDLVNLARDNVVTSSIFRRDVFFEQGVRYVTRRVGGSRFPRDTHFSSQIRALGLEVAWPARRMAISVGFDPAEFARDPEYYIQHYRARVLDKVFWKQRLGEFVRMDFNKLSQAQRRVFVLLRLYCYRIGAKVGNIRVFRKPG
ncbi:MAG: glycosyltransferase family 2 protein [Arenicellales bacterium]